MKPTLAVIFLALVSAADPSKPEHGTRRGKWGGGGQPVWKHTHEPAEPRSCGKWRRADPESAPCWKKDLDDKTERGAGDAALRMPR